MIEDYKNQIQLLEIVSDKILYSNPYIAKDPKNLRIIDNYKSIFEYEEVQKNEEQSCEEQILVLRNMKRGG